MGERKGVKVKEKKKDMRKEWGKRREERKRMEIKEEMRKRGRGGGRKMRGEKRWEKRKKKVERGGGVPVLAHGHVDAFAILRPLRDFDQNVAETLHQALRGPFSEGGPL